MDLSNLQPAKGAVRKRQRVGRGIGSGKGRSSTRGVKGARSRSGFRKRFGYEGGQTPLQQRIPKFGFNNHNEIRYTPINVGRLQQLAEKYKMKEVTPETLREYRIIGKQEQYKILGDGDLSKKLTVKAHAFSQSAQKAIEKAGGTAEKI